MFVKKGGWLLARRTQAERTDATMSALVAAGTRLFGRHGYAVTSIEAVATSAGLTKGAAYHHFDGKLGLFREVFVRQEAALAEALEAATSDATDALAGLRLGCRAFLEKCLEQDVRQIVLLDGPAVLGWEAVREVEEQHTLLLLRHGVSAAADAGWFADGDLDVRSQLVFGALCEAGMLLARAAEPAAALPGIARETEGLLTALAKERRR